MLFNFLLNDLIVNFENVLFFKFFSSLISFSIILFIPNSILNPSFEVFFNISSIFLFLSELQFSLNDECNVQELLFLFFKFDLLCLIFVINN